LQFSNNHPASSTHGGTAAYYRTALPDKLDFNPGRPLADLWPARFSILA